MSRRKVSDEAFLEAIVMLRTFSGRAPSLRELSTVLGIQLNSISSRLRKLAERGLVDLGRANSPRQIQVTDAGRQIVLSDLVEVPVVSPRRPPWATRKAA